MLKFLLFLLSGSDTTSKIGTKPSVLKQALTDYYLEFATFGMQAFDEDMEVKAESLLVKCLSKEDYETFDDLRRQIFYKK